MENSTSMIIIRFFDTILIHYKFYDSELAFIYLIKFMDHQIYCNTIFEENCIKASFPLMFFAFLKCRGVNGFLVKGFNIAKYKMVMSIINEFPSIKDTFSF